MDRAALREGGVVGLWVSELGGEVFHEEDVPGCCRRTAREAGDSFECFSCGARWQAAAPLEPEDCAFMERNVEERKGAA